MVVGRGGGSILPRLAVVVFSREGGRESLSVVAWAPRLACSKTPWAAVEMADAADLKGEVGLRGEMGRAIRDLVGEGLEADMCWGSLRGERGRVRLLWERGERTLLFCLVRDTAREVVRDGAVVVVVFVPRVFLAIGRLSGTDSSESLSEAIWIADDLRFLPRVGACDCSLIGDEDLGFGSAGRAGKGRSCAVVTCE